MRKKYEVEVGTEWDVEESNDQSSITSIIFKLTEVMEVAITTKSAFVVTSSFLGIGLATAAYQGEEVIAIALGVLLAVSPLFHKIGKT